MKKGIKNIIMICILFLILGLTYLTINYAKNNISAIIIIWHQSR